MANMVHKVFGNLILILHTAALPADEEWQAYVNSLAEMPADVRQLVFTDGGRPNWKQRSMLHEVLGRKHNLGSVVSSNRLIRHVVAAINWLGPHYVQSFAPDELLKALQYIRVTEQETPLLMTKAAALATKLSVPISSLTPHLQRREAPPLSLNRFGDRFPIRG